MKRVVEKVKDIVEICPFTHLHDFAADPGLTLAGYHFTDITADLMSKWIERIAAIRPGNGAALALAGFRGVGKSHFLSVLGAIAARPELRSRISDPHVASTAERLSRRHGPVAVVKRGSGESLRDELKRAVGPMLGVDPATLSDSLYDILLRASEQSGDIPLVVLIDTAFGRGSRVSRDDGSILSEIADAAKALGVFVGVALDDDISGADGPNASISTDFNIDYLDQEHLYKIVDSHIFAKHNRMQTVLHEIYEDYRAELPGFRWSEQRFTSLYPLHPAIVEIAPLIRLYIHDFALLGFAAEAGVKILGRPANSLIGIDEVFDGVETRLRQVDELQDAFVAFDTLEREVVAKTPVLFRHPAKLILKGLLVLSLNGEGVTASELAASMMIFGNEDSATPSLNIEQLLDSFSAAVPQAVERISREGLLNRYCFRVSSKVDVDTSLTDAIDNVPVGVPWNVLIGHASEKWTEFDPSQDATLLNVEWRGGIRRGELIWPSTPESDTPVRERKEKPDWTVRVEPDQEEAQPAEEKGSISWKLGKLTADERTSLCKYHLLLSDQNIRASYGEGLSKAINLHSIAVEKIWHRVFLRDSSLCFGGITYRFSDEASGSQQLSQIFKLMLEPIFENQYPAHPTFGVPVGFKSASELISSFLSGSGRNNPDIQTLAEKIAVPLGIATEVGGVLVPTPAEELIELDLVKVAFAGADLGGVVPLKDTALRLQAPPIGLTKEAQHILLAALIAQRQFDFVTSSGNRINHRSLDLQIIWDDIVGVAKPLNELYSAERLLTWARLITGNSGLKSIDRTEDRSLIIDSLSGWLSGWKQSRTIQDFDALPDENLNAGIWRTAANLRKSFGAMADTIDLLIRNDLSLDTCLQLIADLFSDSESEYENKKIDLRVLRDFTTGVQRRSQMVTYLTLCENTGDIALESARVDLIEKMEAVQFTAVGSSNQELSTAWIDFKELYTSFYTARHDNVMNSQEASDKLKEIIRSDAWSLFENLSSIEWLDGRYFKKAKAIIREMRQLSCSLNVTESLTQKPFCGCAFSLSEHERLLDLPVRLDLTVMAGVASYKDSFNTRSKDLLNTADSDAMRTSIGAILDNFSSSKDSPTLTSQEMRILKIAAERIADHKEKIDEIAQEDDEYRQGIPDNMHLWESEVREVEDYVNTEI